MSRSFSEIDWAKLGNSDIPLWLEQIESKDEMTRRKAIQKIKDTFAPWDILDGYGSTEDLLPILERPIPEAIIPFIVEILKNNNVPNKDLILEILLDLARYKYVDQTFVPLDKRASYIAWVKRIHARINEEMDFFRTLLTDKSSQVQVIAEDLIELLSEPFDNSSDDQPTSR
jgi:hypothetical protein